jgi:hypothetical protein
MNCASSAATSEPGRRVARQVGNVASSESVLYFHWKTILSQNLATSGGGQRCGRIGLALLFSHRALWSGQRTLSLGAMIFTSPEFVQQCRRLERAVSIGFRFVATKLSYRDAATFGSILNHAGSGGCPLAHAISAAGRFAPAIWEK